MAFSQKIVELLAPAGNFASLIAAVEAGADAVYLGGKHFNMRLHRDDMNFSDEELEKAVKYAHEHDAKVYITINNLISDEEIETLKNFLKYLDSIHPDAILVQDFAVIGLINQMRIKIPMHASVMMNVHNAPMALLLKENGIKRIVASREMTLSELTLLREKTGMEMEYFIHGDMCISEGGQCIHSGVLFGESSNRGRCLKPCRWRYKLIDDDTDEIIDDEFRYRLALKDMCMYKNIRDLIAAGVYSFKIEGRMRPPEFVRRIVSTYRKAIDSYLADPAGYSVDQNSYKELYDGRARDFTTAFALGQPTGKDIGFDGSREPRFFSKATKEASIADIKDNKTKSVESGKKSQYHRLTVRVADLNGVFAACDNGADTVIIGGESYIPNRPWSLDDIRRAMEVAREYDVRVAIDTPRTTHERELYDMSHFFKSIDLLRPSYIIVGNLGTLRMAQELTCLPIATDFSFNIFNHAATEFLEEHHVAMATASLEMTANEISNLIHCAHVPIEIIVHGAYESMICDHDIAALSLGNDRLNAPISEERRYALLDDADEKHPIRVDQYGRSHILFAKDICLYPFLPYLDGAASYRIEAHDYSAELTGRITKIYRQAVDRISEKNSNDDMASLLAIEKISPRKFGIGAFRFKKSK